MALNRERGYDVCRNRWMDDLSSISEVGVMVGFVVIALIVHDILACIYCIAFAHRGLSLCGLVDTLWAWAKSNAMMVDLDMCMTGTT